MQPEIIVLEEFFTLYQKMIASKRAPRDIIGAMLTLVQPHVTPSQYKKYYMDCKKFHEGTKDV